MNSVNGESFEYAKPFWVGTRATAQTVAVAAYVLRVVILCLQTKS